MNPWNGARASSIAATLRTSAPLNCRNKGLQSLLSFMAMLKPKKTEVLCSGKCKFSCTALSTYGRLPCRNQSTTSRSVLYILLTPVLCIIYNKLIFPRLGNWRFHVSLVLALLGAAALGISYMLEGFHMFQVSLIGLVVCCMLGLNLIFHLEDWQQLRRQQQIATQPARNQKTATDTFTLCREDMLANFRELAAKHELATYDLKHEFLAWNDAQGSDIRIHLLPGDDWVALLYLTPYELRDSEIKAACEKAGVPCPKALLGMAPSGLAIFRGGELRITPASQKKRFDELRERVLAPREEFVSWLRDYTEEA